MNCEIGRAKLGATAVWTSQYPEDGRAEFAFAGKSNVGKSSLINAMVNRNALARSSKQPGKTRTINFFDVELIEKDGDETLRREDIYFVDLPGYGYAKISRAESAKWGKMVEDYLRGRKQLKILFLLLDVRHEPNANDRMLFEWCAHYEINLQAVATKCDKIKKSQLQKHQSIIRRSLGLGEPPLPFSSETKEGRDALRALIMDKAGGGVL